MKFTVKLLLPLLLIAALLTMTLGVALSAGPPIVNPGVDGTAVLLGAVRYRKLATVNDNNIYLGVPDLADATHRTQTGVVWSGNNTISFTYDTTADKLITTVGYNTTEYSLEYPNFSTQVGNLVFGGDQTAADNALNSLNYMQIDVTLKEGSPAQVNLDNVYLDGNLLGDFHGVYRGTQSWQVINYDFSSGFTLTGELNLSGVTSPSGELNNVEISFGNVNADTFAPIITNVDATPKPVAPSGSVTLTATVDDSTTGGSNIQSAEYNLDGGAWMPMSAQDGTFDSPTENVTAAFTAPSLVSGYVLCVRGSDTAGVTSAGSCIALVVSNQGPLTSAVTVVPDKVSGGTSVSLTATVDDSTTGGSNIQSAEYNVDGGAWTPMSAQDGNFDSPSEDVTAQFTAPGGDGTVGICVRGTDSNGATGPQSCANLTIDSLGPVTSSLTATPNPVQPSEQVTISATTDDTTTGTTNIQSAEYQLDGGAWTPMSAQDGNFDSPSEAVTAQFTAPGEDGTVDICVRGTDGLANVGSSVCTQLTISSTTTPPGPLYLPIVIQN
jgi:hypothetical protein